jgi:putative exosortase-associated protein (TIGR04073 family)
MRGAVNLSTGWVEIPKRIHETSQSNGAFAGFTWGLLRGFGYGFIRTAAGGYELLTFPFPAPPGYTPVIQPEYVFTDPSS